MTDLHPIAALDHVIDSCSNFLQTEFRAKSKDLRQVLEPPRPVVRWRARLSSRPRRRS